jgi:hypothetical protein
MGLLDDAIREHLDLKRRRGADPTEVEREEREVLGPVRRRGEEGGADDPAFAEEYEPAPTAHDDDGSWANGGSQHIGDPTEPGPAPAAFDYDPFVEPQREPGAYPAGPEPETDPGLYQAPREPETDPGPYQAPREPEPDPIPYKSARELEPYSTVREPEHYPDAGHEPPDAGPSTVEYSIEDAAEAEEHPHPHREGEQEDVLEETPEFLQDTPDHDRLWFEQRPPRDFDFDG